MLPDGTTEARRWALAWDSLREIESRWAQGLPVRRRLLADCRRDLEASGVPRLERLAELLHPDLTEQELLAAMVPVERVAARVRVTDAEMGITAADRAVRHPFPLTIVADNIRSAFNLGGLFRTADALGAEALWLCGYSATPGHAHVDRAALGAQDSVPWQHWPNVRDALTALRKQGNVLYALETSTRAVAVEQHRFAFPCALMLGSERFGLDPDLVASADSVLRIDTFGSKNSLNVVSALAVAGFAARWSWTESERLP